MVKQEFNPYDWLGRSGSSHYSNKTRQKSLYNLDNRVSLTEIELILQQIESGKIDITKTYDNWRNLGFAFADEFGEKGRNLFHRLSRFYPEYSKEECDKQFDHCLKSNGEGITMRTFFFYAKQAGLLSMPSQHSTIYEHEETPSLPDRLFDDLPGFLKKVVAEGKSSQEKDVLLLGALATLSSCLPNIYGIYDELKVYPNIYLFVTAKAAAGKGRLTLCKELITPVHNHLKQATEKERRQYEMDIEQYKQDKKKGYYKPKPQKPPERMLIIPANNSSTGVFQILAGCNGKGLIFETEGDTLTYAFKTDYGNYSDGFRKAFQHETISYYRRTESEHQEIPTPRLSAVLSGTPGQISGLIPDAENGLLSRFAFYYLQSAPVWKNVFENQNESGLKSVFQNLGIEFFNIYKQLDNRQAEIQIKLSESQQEQFNRFFHSIQDKYIKIYGTDYLATVRRLGLIAFRISMIFTVFRNPDVNKIEGPVICSDNDFTATLSIIEVLIKHAGKVFSELTLKKPVPGKGKKLIERFFDDLPARFGRLEYQQVAQKHKIVEKTADNYIKKLCQNQNLLHEKHNCYQKLK